MNLDRSGIFKARPATWKVKTFPNSQAVAISFEFVIVAQLDGSTWTDWTGYEPVRCFGDFFVVKKTGQPNVVTVQQLATSLGWNGDLRAVFGEPPDCVVQISVKEEVYEGKSYFKASWVNPEDYVPQGGGADEATVEQLQTRFGSLLRAAAAPAKPAPAPAVAEARDSRDAAEAAKYGLDEIPF